jgi:ABC-type amino acid transport substrate-binding protein
VVAIAISYRRDDTGWITGRIFDRLKQHYEKNEGDVLDSTSGVFMDYDSIPAGVDFRKRIKAVLDKSDILLAIIGPRWLAQDGSGNPRITREGDWVRIEIDTALKKNIPVIPVLIDRTPMPDKAALPNDIHDLVYRQAAIVDTQLDFNTHMDRLIRQIDRLLGRSTTEPKEREGRPQQAASTAAQTAMPANPYTKLLDTKLPGRRFPRLFGLAATGASALAALMVLGIVLTPRSPITSVPQWNFVGDYFIGQPIPLAWKYARSAIDNGDKEIPLLFEVSSSDGSTPGAGYQTYADGDHKFMLHINSTRDWRIRVVQSQTKKAVSEWSTPIRVTQYDSAYDRIKVTDKVLVRVSDPEVQGAFKWVDNKGVRGFDIALAKLITDELSAGMGKALQFIPIPVPWTQLLETAGQGREDFTISSISNLESRRQRFGIEFSDSYFCSTHSLIYRTGTTIRSIHEAIKNKFVGAQEKTTSARLAEQLAAGSYFQLKLFNTTENLTDALLRSEIDFGIDDTAFASTAQIATRLNGKDRIGFVEITKDDFPSIPPELRADYYAIAVRSGEDELLSVINKVIDKGKQNGSLARLFKVATQEFEEAHGGAPKGTPIGGTPSDTSWECHQ